MFILHEGIIIFEKLDDRKCNLFIGNNEGEIGEIEDIFFPL